MASPKPPLFSPATYRPFRSCLNCVHKHPNQSSCNAYPNGIPLDILSGETPHLWPIPGDRGIQYEPDPTAPLGLPEGWTLLRALAELEDKDG